MINKNKNKYCYFGIYAPTDMARNNVLFLGLKRNGLKCIKCVDSSKSLFKVFKLIKKHWKIRNDYDFMIVGYLSNIIVPLARVISRKKVIYNALCSMYEGEILDRERYKKKSFGAMYIWLRDFLAFHFANLILVESEAQKRFLSKIFFIRKSKMKVLLTGANDEMFYPLESIKKRDNFSVVFRGWFLPATGVEYVVETAKILKKEGIEFLIIGRGMLRKKIENMISEYDIDNIELITEFLPDDVLREKMLSCNIILGQFADHPRIQQFKNRLMEFCSLDTEDKREDAIEKFIDDFIQNYTLKDNINNLIVKNITFNLNNNVLQNLYLFIENTDLNYLTNNKTFFIIENNHINSIPLIISVSLFLIIFYILFKLTAAPFHIWAPSIYEGAPLPIAMFLSIFSKDY